MKRGRREEEKTEEELGRVKDGSRSPQRGDGLVLCLRTSDLLPVAEHFFDVLQAQQAQLAEGGAAGLRGIESE